MDVNAIAGVSGCLDVGEVVVPHGADVASAVVEEVWLLVAVVEVEPAVAKDDGRMWKFMRDRRTMVRKSDRACAD